MRYCDAGLFTKLKIKSLSADISIPQDGANRQPSVATPGPNDDAGFHANSGCRGLWRTLLAGRGHTLAEAFANLERSSQVERLVRHAQRDLVSARVTLTPEE